MDNKSPPSERRVIPGPDVDDRISCPTWGPPEFSSMAYHVQRGGHPNPGRYPGAAANYIAPDHESDESLSDCWRT
jgi:hypothetical protein